MTTPLWVRIDDLMQEIDELSIQKDKLQQLYDFADFIETHNLIDQEIERLQKQVGEFKDRLLTNHDEAEDVEEFEDEDDDDEEEEEEEEEDEEEVPNSLRKRYTIEHVVMGSDGVIRSVEPGDLDPDRNRYVKEAFRIIYEFRKRKGVYSGVKDDRYVRKRARTYDRKP